MLTRSQSNCFRDLSHWPPPACALVLDLVLRRGFWTRREKRSGILALSLADRILILDEEGAIGRALMLHAIFREISMWKPHRGDFDR